MQKEDLVFPEADFISMQEATRRFDVSLEQLRGVIEKGLLPSYVKGMRIGEYDAIRRFPNSFFVPHEYVKIEAIRWYKDEVSYCKVVIIGLDGMPVKRTIAYNDEIYHHAHPEGLDYDSIMVKPQELRALGQHSEQPVTESPDELALKLRGELKGTDLYKARFIASILHEKYPHLQNGEICELIYPGRYNKGQDKARRKMGERRKKEGDQLRRE